MQHSTTAEREETRDFRRRRDRKTTRCVEPRRVKLQFRIVLAALALATLALWLPTIAKADLAAEQELAERYAPVVRLVEQPKECGPGEPYDPMDVDLLFGESTVSLRGPWNATDLVKIGPTAADIAHLFGYHLDFPDTRSTRAAPTSTGHEGSPRGASRPRTRMSPPTPAIRESSRSSTGCSTPSTTGTTSMRATGR